MSTKPTFEERLQEVPTERWVLYGLMAILAGVLIYWGFFHNLESDLYTQPDPTSRSAKIEQAQRDLDRAQKTLEELR